MALGEVCHLRRILPGGRSMVKAERVSEGLEVIG